MVRVGHPLSGNAGCDRARYNAPCSSRRSRSSCCPADARPQAARIRSPRPGNPVVVISTSLGDITVELFKDKAPVSVENFLQYVERGLLRGHHLPPRRERLRDPGRRLHRRHGREGRPGRRSRTRPPTACATCAARSRWRARSALRSATSQFYINVVEQPRRSITRGFSPRRLRLRRLRPRARRAWTSSTGSPRCRPRRDGGMEDVPVDAGLIKGVTKSTAERPEHRSRCPARSSSSSSRSSSTSSASGSSSRCCRSTRRRSARRRSSSGCCSRRSRSRQLVAAPLLGDLSDRWGRRPVLIFSLLGTVVSFVMLARRAQPGDAVRGAHRRRPVGRQHHDRARLHRRHHAPRRTARKAFGMLGAGVRPRLHRRARRSAALFSHISYTAPIWAAAAITVVATAAGVVLAAGDRASRARRRPGRRGARSRELGGRAAACGCSSPSTSSTGWRSPSTRRRSRCSARGGSASTRRTPATCSARSGSSASSCRACWSGRSSSALGERRRWRSACCSRRSAGAAAR